LQQEKREHSRQFGVIWGFPVKLRYYALQTNMTFESTSVGWSGSS
jgi:hypothetical protein